MKVLAGEFQRLLYRRISDVFYGKLARASAWLFIGGIAAGILGYAFQILMGRMLSTAEYGLFSAIMALFTVLATPLATLMMVISRKVSEYRAKYDNGSITHFYRSISIRTAIYGALILCVYLFFTPQIQIYLRAPSIIPVYLLGALLFLMLLPNINNAFLQGLQSFVWLSASGSFNVLIKIIFAVLLIWLGYGISGALFGTIFAFIASWLITYSALKRPLAEGKGHTFQTSHLSIKPAIPVLAANVTLATLSQLDIVLVNYYFAAHEASNYAAAAVLGKAVMYLPGGIALALFPMVAENHARGQASVKLLLQALTLVAILCGAGAAFYYLFGEWLIGLLYGQEYREAGEVLRYYGFAFLPITMVAVMEHFLVAKGRVMFVYLAIIFIPLTILFVYWFHSSLLMVLGIMALFGSLMLLLGIGMLWHASRKSKLNLQSK